MSPEASPPPKPGDLQFDRVATPGGGASLKCASCGASISTQYFNLGDRAICEACKTKFEGQIAAAKSAGGGAGPMTRSVFLGLGAAILGAAIYYSVIAFAHLEIGIIAILIGYMVGWGVRKGSGGVGGRRYQVLALVLTYLAVALAYSPLALELLTREEPLGALALVLALPVLAVTKSGASGILSAIIIGVGLRQAWRMTAGAQFLDITGPFKVAPVRPAGG